MEDHHLWVVYKKASNEYKILLGIFSCDFLARDFVQSYQRKTHLQKNQWFPIDEPVTEWRRNGLYGYESISIKPMKLDYSEFHKGWNPNHAFFHLNSTK